MLRNWVYRGEIVHNGQSYPGEHEAIIDLALWEFAQARLAEKAVERGTGTRIKNPSLLAGLVFDGDGNRMTPIPTTTRSSLLSSRTSPRRHEMSHRKTPNFPPPCSGSLKSLEASR
jgi:hypothetical protein